MLYSSPIVLGVLGVMISKWNFSSDKFWSKNTSVVLFRSQLCSCHESDFDSIRYSVSPRTRSFRLLTQMTPVFNLYPTTSLLCHERGLSVSRMLFGGIPRVWKVISNRFSLVFCELLLDMIKCCPITFIMNKTIVWDENFIYIYSIYSVWLRQKVMLRCLCQSDWEWIIGHLQSSIMSTIA